MTDKLSRLLLLLEEQRDVVRYNKLAHLWPAEGEFARQFYPKHMELIGASGKHHELGMFGGNGTGKSMFGAGFTAIAATGRYPEWWNGYVVNGPVNWWVAGETNDEVRTSTQKYLLGDVATKGDEFLGTGLIPRDDIIGWKKSPNGNGLCDFVTVRNRAGPGGVSTIRFKSYKEGRKTFQAENLNGAWLDEEPPLDIYGEVMQRFRGETAEGRVLTTCTPLQGVTEFIDKMMNWRDANEKEGASRYVVFIGQREVPHLTEDEINRRLAAAAAHERKARETGMPYVGAGLIYPIPEDQYVINPIPIPSHWRKCFGLDDGWHNTAVVWIAYDRDSDVAYVYSEYKEGEQKVDVHATRIKARGAWIPGAGDAAARDRNSGEQVLKQYRDHGLRMKLPNKAVDAGINEVLMRLGNDKLKVFSTCQKLLEEMRKYRRVVKKTDTNETSVIVKKDDHLVDALRYAIMSGLKIATTQHVAPIELEQVRFG